jgi:hypothetical protein
MKVSNHTEALLLVAALGWAGAPTGVASATQSHQFDPDRLPTSSRCMAKCDEMERKCNAWERLYPTCSTVEICAEEKEQCEALCHIAAMATPRSCS